MKPCLRVALLLVVTAIVPAAAGAQSAEQWFSEANGQYQKSDYAAAEQSYRRLLAQGLENASLYYNLGNACFKQKKLGEAIYYWEKALRFAPGDSDIRENLNLANLMIVDRIEVPQDPVPVRLLTRLVHYFTLGRESVIAFVLFLLANLFFALYLVLKHPGWTYRAFVASMIMAALTLLLACSLAWKVYEQENQKQGIVVEQKVDIKAGPGQENVTVVTVHEGIKVRVRGETGGWLQVSLPNGWSGWVQRNTVRIIGVGPR